MKRFLLIFLALAIVTMTALAQNPTELRGRVTDERSANIEGAEVRLRSRSGGEFSTTTDGNGTYSFTSLTEGEYVLEVRAKGFASFVSRVTVNRGQSMSNDVSLSVDSISETVSVTGTGTAQTVDETSKSDSVIIIDSRNRHKISLSEVVRGGPAIRVQQQGSPGALTSVRLRGQRTFDTSVLLDGLRVRDASDINGGAGPLFADLVPADLDRIEIVRGSGSSIYGTNAIGGVMNMVPSSAAGNRHLQFGFEGGSLGLFRGTLRGSGELGPRAGFSVGLSRVDVRNGVDGSDEYGNTAGSGRFQFHPTGSSTLSASFYGTISNARLNDSPFALPGAFAAGQYPAAVEGQTFNRDFNNPDQGRRNRLLVGSVRFTDQVNEAISYSLAYQHVGSKRRNYNGPAIDPQFASPVFYPFGEFEFVAVNNGSTDTFDARGNFRFGGSNLATVGFEYERESFFQSSLPSFSAFNNTTDRQRTVALFAQDQIFLLDDRLQMSIGARGQWFHLDAADRPGTLSSINPESSITGDFSLAYFIRSTGTKLRAHVGNGFRGPSLFERFGAGTFAGVGLTRFGDPTLRAEQSISVDGGFDQRVAGDRARFGATYFYTRLQRVIAFNSFFIVDPIGAGRFSGYENRPGGLARGVETYFQSAPWTGADWHVSYTFTNSDRFVRGQGLQPEQVIPKHLFGFLASQRYRSLTVNFDFNYTGSYIAPIFENNFPFRTAELTFPSYIKADLFASYERRASDRVTLTFFGGADNLFDVTYFENGFRAPGIMARGGVNVRFK